VGYHGFRPGNSCENQVITVCQGIAVSLNERVDIYAIITDYFKAFDLVPHGRLLKKVATSIVDLMVVVCVRDFLVVQLKTGQIRRRTIHESQIHLRCGRRERFGATNIYSVRE